MAATSRQILCAPKAVYDGNLDSVFHFLSIYSVFFQKKGFKPQYMRV